MRLGVPTAVRRTRRGVSGEEEEAARRTRMGEEASTRGVPPGAQELIRCADYKLGRYSRL